MPGNGRPPWTLTKGPALQIGGVEQPRFKMDEVLRLQDVSCARDGRVIVDRVNLAMSAGTLTVVRGGRGAGKSTLLAVAAAALRPGAGSVFIAGRDVLALQHGSLPFVRRNIGYLPPEPPLLLEESALENVMLALGVRGFSVSDAEEAATEALRQVGLPDAVAHVAAEDLSQTERHLLALARTVVGAPPLVIVDEPAFGARLEDRRRVVELLAGLREQGVALLCATAEPSFAQALEAAGGDVFELHAGRLVGEPRMTVLRGRVTPPPEEDEVARHAGGCEEAVDEPEELDAGDLEDVELDDAREGRS